ncbi:UbiA family prenyltransferase [Nodularia harveyana UHCC-0300]|uniref:UbiA family prenyltransferase n=1 Tax=Nodularia harveyana UHCC-0300 TaxID=2974287 RepID=A0ABU5UBY4_9CYAN|nr:UbiA family prenyltransferase [Nodularia harveyana]MEA5581044.1 UbiA family prenyltransferase [Nodularia harveyana UHCC-0300]
MIQLEKLAAVIRAKDWWVYKLGAILGSGYATSAILDVSLFTLWPALIFLLIALVLDATFASIINDICDAEEDHISGKTNYMFGRSPLFITSVLIATILPGLIVLVFLRHTPLILGIYVSNWLVFALYSIPPIRLKKRGFWGVLAIALGESFLPHLFAVLWIGNNAHKPLPFIWLILIGVWSLAAGLRSILWHQLQDIENDLGAGVNTFAVSNSPLTLQRLGKWIVFPAEVIALMGILFFFHHPLIWILLSVYLITEYLRHYFWKINIIIVKPSGNDRLALFEYYDIFYPLGAIYLAIEKDPINLIFLGIYVIFYSSRIWWWCRDARGLLTWDIPAYYRKLKN